MHTFDERIRDEYKDLQAQKSKIGREKCEAVRGVRVQGSPRKVYIWLPGKGNSNSHGARPVY